MSVLPFTPLHDSLTVGDLRNLLDNLDDDDAMVVPVPLDRVTDRISAVSYNGTVKVLFLYLASSS